MDDQVVGAEVIRFNPKALASCGDDELDERPEVQGVSYSMILEYIIDSDELPGVSARPFARWLNEEWNGFNEDGDATNGDVLQGALLFWRGL